MDKFPKLFPIDDRNNPRVSLLCFGFECEAGWYPLIEELSEKIQKHIDETDADQVTVSQVKEKYGGLRYYLHNGDDFIYDLISEYEKKSMKTCEKCGKPGELRTERPWIKTLCDKCNKNGI